MLRHLVGMTKSQSRLIFKQLGLLDGISRSLGAVDAPDSDATETTDNIRAIHDAVLAMREKLVYRAERLGLYPTEGENA